MATNTTNESCRPSCLILKAHASVQKRRNRTTTTCPIKQGIIEVSFWPDLPPFPSNLYVYLDSPELGPSALLETPSIFCMVEDLFLLRVAIAQPDRSFTYSRRDYDYFIYRADPKRRFLKMLPHPYPINFYADQVGLLPRGDHCTVAVLLPVIANHVFELHMIDSEDGSSWRSKKLSVDVPLREFTIDIPENCSDLLYHDTSTVITLGGEAGTMGWVDLWRGILFCDVMSTDPILRAVPLPLPMQQIKSNEGQGVVLGCPKPYRGISYNKGKGCLKFVELEDNIKWLRYIDDETGSPAVKVEDWSIKIFSNFNIAAEDPSMDDWKLDFETKAGDIGTNCVMHAEMFYELMQSKPLQDSETAAERTLQNLLVSDPYLSVDDAKVVYLLTRVKIQHHKAWVLAIDVQNNTLQGVTEFGTPTPHHAAVLYCVSNVFTATSKDSLKLESPDESFIENIMDVQSNISERDLLIGPDHTGSEPGTEHSWSQIPDLVAGPLTQDQVKVSNHTTISEGHIFDDRILSENSGAQEWNVVITSIEDIEENNWPEDMQRV